MKLIATCSDANAAIACGVPFVGSARKPVRSRRTEAQGALEKAATKLQSSLGNLKDNVRDVFKR